MGEESIAGTYIGKRDETVISAGSASVLYKPRSGGLNSNLKHYTAE